MIIMTKKLRKALGRAIFKSGSTDPETIAAYLIEKSWIKEPPTQNVVIINEKFTKYLTPPNVEIILNNPPFQQIETPIRPDISRVMKEMTQP